MPEARQYGPDFVELDWGGIDIKRGIAKGTFFQEQIEGGGYTIKQDGIGGGIYIFDPSRTGEIQIQVDQESATHRQLRARYETDRITHNQTYALVMHDASSADVHTYSNARIMRDPDESRGHEGAVVTYRFGFIGYKRTNSNENANLVTSS
jgi:hypothetical protein